MSSTAIIWTVTIMGALWAPVCHFSWTVDYQFKNKKEGEQT